MKLFFNSYWRSALWLMAITIASLVNKVPVKAPDLNWIGPDKVVHFIFYATLTLVLFIDGNKLKPTHHSVYWLLIFPVAYGGLIELVQGAMAGSRSAEWGDFAADLLGSLFVYFIIIPVYKRNIKRR